MNELLCCEGCGEWLPCSLLVMPGAAAMVCEECRPDAEKSGLLWTLYVRMGLFLLLSPTEAVSAKRRRQTIDTSMS